MRYAFTHLSGCNLGLNATRAARRLYHSLGFVTEKTVYQCQREAIPPDMPPASPDEAVLRAIGQDDLSSLGKLDKEAYGVDRTRLLAELLSHSQGLGLFRNGRIEAFSLCRAFGRGHLIGPVVANNDGDAIAVIRPHVAGYAGRFLRLDTSQHGGPYSKFVDRSGLSVFDTVTTMRLGELPVSHRQSR
jgi:hypothetical protein